MIEYIGGGFEGEGFPRTVTIVENGEIQGELDPRHDLYNHSPNGFAWGYGGSGPAQLALALLAHATGDDDFAVKHHQDYKFEVVAALPQDTPWRIGRGTIRQWAVARMP